VEFCIGKSARNLIAIKLLPGAAMARWNSGALKIAGVRSGGRRMQLGVARMDSSERTIIELNIRHYRTLLTTEMDAAKRQTIATLLAEEEAKLVGQRKKGASGGIA
jgi:hypothetical protein